MAKSRWIRRNRGWVAAGTLAVIALVAYTMLQGTKTDEITIEYRTEAAAVGTISVTVSGTGNLAVDGTSNVFPPTPGTVDEVLVAQGDPVTTGTVLFTLDADAAKANTAHSYSAYLQSKQGVSSSEGQLMRAENTLADLQELFDAQASSDATAPVGGTVITEEALELAEHDVTTAEEGLTASKASRSNAWVSYETAKAAEDDLRVCASESGYVLSVDIEPGDIVSGAENTSAAPLVIGPEQPLSLHLTINEVDVPAIAVGQRADIEFDALSDLTATGKVYEIADEGFNTQGVVTFDVWLSVDVLDERLRAGMSGAASIVTDFERDTLLVPNGSVKSDGDGGHYVEVLDPGAEEPRRVVIETGLSNATDTQVLSGLREGDAVVTQTIESGGEDDAPAGGGFMMPGAGRGK